MVGLSAFTPHQQMSNIIIGSFECENDGEKRSLGQGDSVLLASGAKHVYRSGHGLGCVHTRMQGFPIGT